TYVNEVRFSVSIGNIQRIQSLFRLRTGQWIKVRMAKVKSRSTAICWLTKPPQVGFCRWQKTVLSDSMLSRCITLIFLYQSPFFNIIHHQLYFFTKLSYSLPYQYYNYLLLFFEEMFLEKKKNNKELLRFSLSKVFLYSTFLFLIFF